MHPKIKQKETSVANQVAKKENTDLSTAGGATAPPAYLAEKMATAAGKGVSTDAADNQVPLIYVLQSNSPQVDRKNPAYVEGAEPGDIWLRGAPVPIVKGDEGFLFQPCHFSKDWVEWIPRDTGGGFVGRHRDRPTVAAEHKDPKKPGKVVSTMPSGNEVKETRNHAGIVHAGAQRISYSIPLTSSGHSVSREWMAMMSAKRDSEGRVIPACATLYRLKTRQRKNVDGTWYVLKAEDAGFVSEVDFARGEALHDAFVSGEKQAEAPVENDHENLGEEAPF